MLKRIRCLLLAVTLVLGLALNAGANLQAVGPLNLANGYPLWWQDLGGTQVELCLEAANCPLFEPLVAGNAFSEQIGFSGESFWWAAGADMEANPAGVVLFEYAMEAAFFPEVEAPGNQEPFVRLRVRADADVIGAYTIAHPFGTMTVNVDAVGNGLEINETIDIGGTAAAIPPYSEALLTGVPPVNVTAPAATHGVSDFFVGVNPAPPVGFMGVPGAASTVSLGNPNVTITGPGGAFGAAGNTLTNNGLWDVAGKLFVPGTNVAPVAIPDLAGALVDAPTTVNVAGNDQDVVIPATNDHGINPLAVALGSDTVNLVANAIGATSSTPTTQGGTATINADSSIAYTPPAAFTGVDTFPYLVQDTGGLVAATTAIVTVEQMQASAALRAKVMKWDISGTSTVSNLTATEAVTGDTILFTNLAGAFEVPPVASAGTGSATFTVRGTLAAPTSIDFTLEATGLATDVLAAHIHSGAFGVNGGVTVGLFDAGVDGPFPATGVFTGTLLPADVLAPFNGDLAALVAAMTAGDTYVNVHTTAVPSGELRGQIGRNAVAAYKGTDTAGALLGAGEVKADGSWSLPKKGTEVPASGQSITVQTAGGNLMTVPLNLK